jgi:hypothetical protein
MLHYFGCRLCSPGSGGGTACSRYGHGLIRAKKFRATPVDAPVVRRHHVAWSRGKCAVLGRHLGRAFWVLCPGLNPLACIEFHSICTIMAAPSPIVPSLPSRIPNTALYSDPLYLTRGASPYYQDSHYRLQRELREYVDTHISPFCEEWETKGKVPDEVLTRHAELGYAAVSVYPLATEYLNGQRLPADIKATEWDGFHDLIFIDEIARCGYLGVIWGLSCGNSIGAPPLVNYGSHEQKRRFLPDVLQGRSRFCLGVTEPDGML